MAWMGNPDPVTYQDWVAMKAPDGELLPVVELLQEYCPVIKDAVVLEANDTDGHTGSVRTGYPTGTWRLYNVGVQPTKPSQMTVRDTIGNYEQRSEVDKDIADKNGNTAMFRLTQAAGHLEGIAQTFESVFWYGDSSTPEKFIGMTPRFNNYLTAQNSSQLIDGGSDTDDVNMSMWGLTWDPRFCHLIFPKGSQGGIRRENLGEGDALDSNAYPFRAYKELYKLQVGLHIPDWRRTFRVCNLKTASVLADSVDLIKLLIKAIHKVKRGQGGGNKIIYCNPDIAASLDVKANEKANVLLRMKEFAGEEVLMFRDWVIRETDGLIQTESKVAFS